MGKLTDQLLTDAGDAGNPISDDSEFTKGLRSGWTSAKGNLRALAGGVAEAVGADELAREQYAQSQALQQQSGAEAPRVQSYRDVGGLRDAWDYASGMAGQSLPLMGAGLAAGGITALTGGGALPVMAASTLATAPFMTGEAIQRQQDDPVALQKGAGERLATAAGVGLGSAALENAVPLAMGAKLVGKAATKEAVRGGLRATLAKNVAEGVLGEGATEGAQEYLQQAGHTLLNPERDKSKDTEQLLDNAVGGAVMGGLFGGAGAAGEMAHAKRGAAGAAGDALTKRVEGVASKLGLMKGEPKATDAERAQGIPLGEAKGEAGAGVPLTPEADVGIPLQDKVLADHMADVDAIKLPEPAKATGDDHFPAGIETMPPEQQKIEVDRADNAALLLAQQRMRDLSDSPAVSPEDRKILKTLDPAKPEDQIRLKDIAANATLLAKKRKQVATAAKKVNAEFTKFAEGKTLSLDSNGAAQRIYESMGHSEWPYLDHAAGKEASEALSKIIVMAEHGEDIPKAVLDRVHEMIGKDPVPVLVKAHGLVGSRDVKLRQKFAKVVKRMVDIDGGERNLITTVRNAMPPDLIDSAPTHEIHDLVAKLKSVFSEERTRHMPKAEADLFKQRLEAQMYNTFGDKAGDIYEAFRQWAADDAAQAQVTPADRTDSLGAATKTEHEYEGRGTAPDGEMDDGTGSGKTIEQVDWHGTKKKDGTTRMILSDDAHRRAYPADNDAMRPQARRMKEVSEAHPSAEVSWVSARDYAKEHELTDKDLHAMTEGRPDDYGMVRTRTVRDPEAFTWQDVDAMRISTDKSSHYNSKARIDTGDGGPIIDAMAVSRVMEKRPEMKDVATKSAMQRKLIAFELGISHLSDMLGTIVHVPDDTLVYSRGGEGVTYGELKHWQDFSMSPEEREKMKVLRGKLEKTQEPAARRVLHDEIKKLNDANPIFDPREDYQSSGRTTSELRAITSDMELQIERSERALVYLRDKLRKGSLTDKQQDSWDFHTGRVKRNTEMIGHIDAAIARRSERAQLAEHKELGNDFGTGVDSGEGINQQAEQARVVERDKLRYKALMDKLNEHAPGSAEETAVWDAEARRLPGLLKQVEANAKGDNEAAKAPARAEYKKLKAYQRVVDARDRALLERLHSDASAQLDTLREQAQANSAGRRDDAPLGVSEIDPMGQIHLAAADHEKKPGDLGEIVGRMRNTAGEETGTATAGKGALANDDGTPSKLGREALSSRIASFAAAANNKIARALVTKAQDIFKHLDKMTATHQAEFLKVAKMKTLSTATDTIDRLHSLYGGKWNQKEQHRTEPALQKWANTIANEGGEQHAANLAQVKRVSDVARLKNTLDVLMTDRNPSEPKQALIAAYNQRIGELTGKSEPAQYEAVTTTPKKEVDKAAQDDFILKEDYSKLNTPEKVMRFLRGARERLIELHRMETDDEGEGITDRKLANVYGTLDTMFTKWRGVEPDLASFMHEVPGFWDLPAKEQQALEQQAQELTLTRSELGELARGKVKYSKMKTGTTETTVAQRAAVNDYIKKVLGDTVDIVHEHLGYSGAYVRAGADLAKATIYVSKTALFPQSVAHHESMHAFFHQLISNGFQDVATVLIKASDSAPVKAQLRKLLRDQPDALRQIEISAEERLAYMYQFWANGQLKLGDGAANVFQKIGNTIAKVLGTWTNDQRALHIMEYFSSGEFQAHRADMSAAHKAMMDVKRNRTLDHLAKCATPLAHLGETLAVSGHQRLRDTGIPVFARIADLTKKHDTRAGEDPGYVTAAATKARDIGNQLTQQLADASKDGKITFDEINAAFSKLLEGKKVGDTVAQTNQMVIMKKHLRGMFDYMTTAGVHVRDMGEDYVPRVWDPAKLAAKQDDFKAVIQKYIDAGKYDGTADGLLQQLMGSEGNEIQVNPDGTPGNQHIKERVLRFITPEDAAPFLENDAMRVMTSYIRQAAKRAEWARRFGHHGKVITTERGTKLFKPAVNPDGSMKPTKLEQMKAQAREYGATDAQMKMLDDYLLGVTGQLGGDVSPKTRKLFGEIIVYQNLRLLPLGIFAASIEPIGIVTRGGKVSDAFNAYKRAVKDIRRGFQHDPKPDAQYKLAEDLRVIDTAVLQHVLGATYGLNAVGQTARKVNELLFKYNLMEQFSTSMRVAGTQAAIGFILKHKDGNYSEHSPRYLAELGLKPSDIHTNKEGQLIVRKEEFVKVGMDDEEATAAHLKMVYAVNQWVDGAILRPDPTQKAIWMNDAHFSVIAHMKQFVFAFQDTIMKRAMHEIKHGNYTPAYAMTSYIPVMIAADLVKGMLQGGGEQPEWKQNWELSDYLMSGLERSGLMGVGQFGFDAFKEIRHGGTGLGALGGPTINQFIDVASTLGGARPAARTFVEAMPANALWSGYLPSNWMKSDAGSAGKLARAEPEMSVDERATD